MAQTVSVEVALARVNSLLGSDLQLIMSEEHDLSFLQSNAYGIVNKNEVAAGHLDVHAIRWSTEGELQLPCSSPYKHCVKSIHYLLDQEKRSSILRLKPALQEELSDQLAEALRDMLDAIAMESAIVVTPRATERMTTDYLKLEL